MYKARLPLRNPQRNTGSQNAVGGRPPPALPRQLSVALLAHLLLATSTAGHGGAEAEAAGAEGPAAARTAALRGHKMLLLIN